VETLDSLKFPEELKMIDICALGPLRVTSALNKGGFFKENSSRIVMITSQGGAISWRTTQNPTGEDCTGLVSLWRTVRTYFLHICISLN